jgi:hypothetical protein
MPSLCHRWRPVDHDQPRGRDHDDGIAVGPTVGKHRTWKKVGIRRDLARRRWSGSTRHGLGERQSEHERRGHHYDALQASANRRFIGGLQFGAAYTWSRTFDVGNEPTYQPLREWSYGPAVDHQPHVLVINYTWDLPRAKGRWDAGVVRAVLDGWQLAGVTAFASGYPVTPGFSTTDGQDIWGGGDGRWIVRTGEPNLPHGDRTFDRWFDTSVF